MDSTSALAISGLTPEILLHPSGRFRSSPRGHGGTVADVSRSTGRHTTPGPRIGRALSYDSRDEDDPETHPNPRSLDAGELPRDRGQDEGVAGARWPVRDRRRW